MGSDLASIMPAIHVHQPSTTCFELQHPKVIDEYLKEETRLGHVIGPFDAQEVKGPEIENVIHRHIRQ